MSLTIETLLERAQQSKNDKFMMKKYKSKLLGGELTIVRQPLTKIISIIGDMDENRRDMVRMISVMCELIYVSVPLFRDKRLQKEYEVAEPYDVVQAVLNDNVDEITELAEAIFEMYGLKELKDKTKK